MGTGTSRAPAVVALLALVWAACGGSGDPATRMRSPAPARRQNE